MHQPLTIDFEPDNRDVYRTLDGLGLFSFRFEQQAEGWAVFSEQTPEPVIQRLLPGAPQGQPVCVGLRQPVTDLRQAKAFAAQWAEQVWRKAHEPQTQPASPWEQEGDSL